MPQWAVVRGVVRYPEVSVRRTEHRFCILTAGNLRSNKIIANSLARSPYIGYYVTAFSYSYTLRVACTLVLLLMVSSSFHLWQEDAYKNVSDACSSSGIVEESTLSSLCRPRPIADCRQTQPEKRVDGANETASSCYIASFIPGTSYYLASKSQLSWSI